MRSLINGTRRPRTRSFVATSFVATRPLHGVDAASETQGDAYASTAEADVVVLLQQHDAYAVDRIAAASIPVLSTRGVMNVSARGGSVSHGRNDAAVQATVVRL